MREGDIRWAVRRRLTELHRDEPGTIYRNELGLCLGQTRVDVAAINGEISGYEIKSGRDTLARFPAQVEVYGRVLDRACIVVEERHLAGVMALTPDWWGIWLASGDSSNPAITEHRRGASNTGHDRFSVAQLLWREEALAELQERDLAAGARRATRWALWNRLAELPLDDLREAVRRRLRLRDSWPGG
jgi:hypothetical protein